MIVVGMIELTVGYTKLHHFSKNVQFLEKGNNGVVVF